MLHPVIDVLCIEANSVGALNVMCTGHMFEIQHGTYSRSSRRVARVKQVVPFSKRAKTLLACIERMSQHVL